MMAEPMFLERRTRSQLTLPDEILHIPQRSPLKDAKTALRNQAAANETLSTSRNSSEETDDELLLSPGKIAVEKTTMSTSKRSASPDPEDEYLPRSGSPSEGRELKRAKRDVRLENEERNPEKVEVPPRARQRSTSRHARNHSEPNMLVAQRSGRKRSATSSKKPVSTISDGTPPSAFSPTTSPKKCRAQSVPLFFSTDDIPRIDFRNPPPSPKRSKSRSQSPAKETLRITSGQFQKSASLPTMPTIEDESVTVMDVTDETSSVPEELELPCISEHPLESQSLTASETTDELSTSYTTLAARVPIIPATPITQSLNRLIPMSPLTPVPETPFPGRNLAKSGVDSRTIGNTGWGTNLFPETAKALPVAGPSTTKSRLPRPSTVMASPSIPHPKSYHSSNMGPPKPLATTTSKKPGPVAPITGKMGLGIPPKRDAFTFMMKAAQAKMMVEKAKVASQTKSAGPPLFSVPSETENAVAGPLDKMKMKQKMRPREKPKMEKVPLLVPLLDEEEEKEEELSPYSRMKTEKTPSRTSPKPSRSTPHIIKETIVTSPEVRELAAKEEGINHDISTGDDPLHSAPTTSSYAIAEEDKMSNSEVSGATVAKIPDPKEQGREEPPAEVDAPTSFKPGPSKLPLGKKRQPTSVAPASRVTRSISKQNDKGVEEPKLSAGPIVRRKKPTPTAAPAKRTASGSIKKRRTTPEDDQAIATDPIEEGNVLPPGSPMRLSSPAKAASSLATKEGSLQTISYGAGKLSLAKTPTKSWASKPASSPSPSKIARASSLFIKPSSSAFSRTFSIDSNQPSTATGSSLSTLSNALEKLRMPAPSRPNTSMGFNRDAPRGDDASRSMDDTTVGHAFTAVGTIEGVKRATSVGADAFKRPSSNPATLFNKTASSGKNLVQKPLLAFMSGKGNTGGIAAVRGGRAGTFGNKSSIFGVGGPARKLISKKTSLPMVMGSPVKGGGDGDSTMQEYKDDMEEDDIIPQSGNDSDIFMAPENSSAGSLLLEDLQGETSGKGKEKANSKVSHASRVSSVSHALSMSLSALPVPTQPSVRGLMGPPATPPSAGNGNRNTSTYPSASASTSSPSQAVTGTRSSARIAKSTANPVLLGRKAEAAPPSNPAAETLKILNDCVIFVDVKTDDGDEAGSLFVEMLEGVGARVLTRVGQSCTHIVYKNGLMSTLARYRLLRDPKPLVVGIGWVVECVEQRKHVEEVGHLVDLDGVNLAGTNKRRRSMLPKLFHDSNFAADPVNDEGGDGDQSMDESNSSATADDDLAPLERARRRKSMMNGIRP